MPLYGNILLSSDEHVGHPTQEAKPQAKTSAPKAGLKLLQDHLMSKKRSKQASLHPHKVQRLSDKSHAPINSVVKHSEFDWDLFDEYDPMIPNNYEILKIEAIKAEEQRINATKNSVGKIDPSILDVLDRLEEGDALESKSNVGATIAPPPMTVVPKTESNPAAVDPNGDFPTTAISGEKLDGTSTAAKIMAKMGFKLGQGLGRNEQGMNAPLEVEKSGPSAGRIVQKCFPTTQVESKPECTRVLLLQNMVGPGEVDDELEEETKMECMKYGHVIKCLIYEIPNKKVPDDQAVRIFIEFEDSVSAKKAADELDGRYFGGRTVRASFYEVDKFHRYELGP